MSISDTNVGTSKIMAEMKLPMWHGTHQLSAGSRRAKAKKKRIQATQEIGDVSEALRREFVQFAVAGVARSVTRATSNINESRTAELLREPKRQSPGAICGLPDDASNRYASRSQAVSQFSARALLPQPMRAAHVRADATWMVLLVLKRLSLGVR